MMNWSRLPLLLALALCSSTWLGQTGCGEYDPSCSTPGTYKCDFYVAALMECKDFGGGKIEWTTFTICPRGMVCMVNTDDPPNSCVQPGADVATGTPDATADASDATDASSNGTPDSVDGFIERFLDVSQ